MKRLVAAGLLTLMLVAGIWVGGPYYTLHRLHVAIEARDAASLENQVDFPLLRENIKLQFHARAAQAAPPRWRESPLAGLAMGLTVQMVDGAVDALVTPSGLLGFLEQQTTPVERDVPRCLAMASIFMSWACITASAFALLRRERPARAALERRIKRKPRP